MQYGHQAFTEQMKGGRHMEPKKKNTSKKERYMISDHNPLVLSSGHCKPRKQLQFKFETCWLKNPEFLPLVENIWKKTMQSPIYFGQDSAKTQADQKIF